MLADRAILGIADSQLGLITRAQALRSGLTDDQIRHRLGTESLVVLHRGVYRVSAGATSFAQRALAGCLACGTGVVASHRTAAALFQLMEPATHLVDVTIPSGRCRRPAGVSVHRSRVLGRRDCARVGGVPVTSPARTLLDLAGVLSVDGLESAMDDTFRAGLITPDRLLAYVERSEFRRACGSGRVRELSRDRIDGVPESVLEGRMLRLIRAYGLPEPVRQHEVRTGGRIVRFDLAYPDHHLAIELDGRGPHWGRERWQSDHDRHNATEAAGRRTLRFTWLDVTERCSYVALAVGEGLGLRPARWRLNPRNRSR